MVAPPGSTGDTSPNGDTSLPPDREISPIESAPTESAACESGSSGLLFVDEPHPAMLPDEELAAECDVQRTRRGGPGGQHRNKVESAIVLTHRGTGIEATASERRSQHENRSVALFRLRCSLAVRARSRWVEPFAAASNDGKVSAQSGTEVSSVASSGLLPQPCELWRNRCKNQRIVVNPEHADFPTMLAIALDMIAAYCGDTRPAATQLGVTATQLHRFCQLEPAAWKWLAGIRSKHKLPTLK